MIHELRIYHCVSGQIPVLLKRFEEITLPLWEKHGICQAGFWTVEVGPSNHDLYYMLELLKNYFFLKNNNTVIYY